MQRVNIKAWDIVPWKPYLWAWLLKFSQYYRRRRGRRRWLLATKLATLIQLMVVYMKICGRTSSLLQYSCKMPKIINIGQRRDTTHATEATPATSLPSSRKFWYSLTVSNPSSHDRLAFFCYASTRTVLTRTVGITEYKGHLNLKRSTAKRHIKTTLLRPTYSLQAGDAGFDNDIVAKQDVKSRYTSLAFNGYAHLWCSRELYFAVT